MTAKGKQSQHRRMSMKVGPVLALLFFLSTDVLAALSLSPLCNALVPIMKSFIGALASLIIVLAGYNWVQSGDDPGRRKKAIDMIINAVIGLVFLGVVATLMFEAFGTEFPSCPGL